MNRSRLLLVGLATILLLAFLAACGGDDDDSDAAGQPSATSATSSAAQATSADEEPTEEPEDEPTATETEDEPAATEDGEEPTRTSESDSSDDRLVGSASVEDEREDVSNLLMSEPDEPMPGIDLTRVQLEGDGTSLVATIETAGDIADELSEDVEVSFDVHLWQDDKPAYALSFHHDGSGDWEATVTDFSGLGSDEETIETEIRFSGNTLSAAFPVDMLPELESEFEWYASVMLSEGGMPISPDAWFDGAPENVIALLADPEQFVEFPQ
jgi:hypothetical protein